MPPAQDVRRAAFAAFVRRVVEQARVQHDWTLTQIIDASRVGRSTFYRWLRGDWETEPHPAKVVAFCDAFDVPASAAFTILWPGKTDRPQLPEPAPMDPDIAVLQRRLRDPNTAERERYLIRETIRGLAARTSSTGRRPPEQDIDQAG